MKKLTTIILSAMLLGGCSTEQILLDFEKPLMSWTESTKTDSYTEITSHYVSSGNISPEREYTMRFGCAEGVPESMFVFVRFFSPEFLPRGIDKTVTADVKWGYTRPWEEGNFTIGNIIFINPHEHVGSLVMAQGEARKFYNYAKQEGFETIGIRISAYNGHNQSYAMGIQSALPLIKKMAERCKILL